MSRFHSISILKGLTLSAISRIEKNDDNIITFNVFEGFRYRLFHDQDCCESVTIFKIDGNLQSLVGSKIEIALEIEYPNGVIPQGIEYVPNPDSDDSKTWTEIILATDKETVRITWLGISNGYYSESVHFAQVDL